MRPTGPLLRCLGRSVRSGAPTQLQIGGGGTVSLYPREGRYVSDVRDWDRVFQADHVRVAPALWDTAPDGAPSLDELLWRAHFHAVKVGVLRGSCTGCELVQLLDWPDAARVPGELLEPVALVCRVLDDGAARTGAQVAEASGLPAESACAVLRVLRDRGHLRVVETAPACERCA